MAVEDAVAAQFAADIPAFAKPTFERAEHDLDGARSRLEESLRTSRRIGSNRGMAGAIDGLASLATDLV
jgi:hypothetical protein